MRRKTVALITVVGSLVVAACSTDRDTTAPRSIAPAPSQAALVNFTGLVCDPTALRAAAKDFFASQQDPGITAVNNLIKTPSPTYALDVLKNMADARWTGRQKTGSWAAGGTLATQSAICGPLVSATLGYPTNFDPDSALKSGIFEVMNATATTQFVLAYNGARSSTDRYVGTPPTIWGIEGIWPAGNLSSSESRYLVYAYPTSAYPKPSLELGTLPVSVDAAGLVNNLTVAECVRPFVGTNTVNLFKHTKGDNTVEVLNLKQTGFCAGHTFASAGSRLEMFSRRLAALISPKPAYAQIAFDGSGGGSGWSPWTLGSFTGTDITLAFTPNPSNAFTGTPVTVKVTATGSPPLPPIVARLTITGNQGSPTAFYECNASTNTCSTTATDHLDATVDPATGVATFYFQYAKAGGTDLTAVGFVGGTSVQTQSVTAPQIQVQNK
jgi:hypothetical protein